MNFILKNYRAGVWLIVVLGLMIVVACGKGNKAGETEFVSAVVQEQYRLTGTLEENTAALDESTDATTLNRLIEESDIIKVEGSLLYILNRYRGLTICDVSTPDSPVISGNTPVSGSPEEMYIRGGMAYIFVSKPFGCEMVDDVLNPRNDSGTESVLYAVSVENAASPVITDTINLDGQVTDSRLVGSILYAVTTSGTYSAESGFVGNTCITSVDISDSAAIHRVDKKDISNTAKYIHVTEEAIFTVSSLGYFRDEQSTITYIDISDAAGSIAVRGSIDVSGRVSDKFKLDHHEGYLRVCTYDPAQRKSNLMTIRTTNPDSMELAAKIALAEGEQLFATRFDGDRAYMVTFLQVDPLWVIDLSDQENPVVAGELEVPGWSTHIEPRGNRLLALGVDNDSGGRKVSVSLFDVEKPGAPSLVNRVSFGEEEGWAWTEGYNDYRAFSVIDDLGLILLPYTTWNLSEYRYENRLQLIDFSSGNLVPRGRVRQQGDILRSGTLSNRLFAVSDDELQVINAEDLDNPVVSASLQLSENIRKLVPMDNGYGVVVIDKTDGTTELRSVVLSNVEQVYGTTVSVGRMCSDVISIGSSVVVTSDIRNENSAVETTRSNLRVIDFTQPENPQIRGDLVIPGSYYKAYDKHGANRILPWNRNRIHGLNETVLLFECHEPSLYGYYDRAEDTSGVIGFNGLIMVDFKNPDAPDLISIHEVEQDILNLFTVNQTAYYTFFEKIPGSIPYRDEAKYYLGRIDLENPEKPVELPPVNIPGTCLGLDATGRTIFTYDQQWESDVLKSYFYSLVLTGDKAVLMDKVQLETAPGSVAVGKGRLFFQASREMWYCGNAVAQRDIQDCMIEPWVSAGNSVYTVDTGSPDNIQVFEKTIGGNSCYALIAGAVDQTLLIESPGNLILFDASDPADLSVSHDAPVNGWMRSVTVSENALFAALGHYGIKVLTVKSE